MVCRVTAGIMFLAIHADKPSSSRFPLAMASIVLSVRQGVVLCKTDTIGSGKIRQLALRFAGVMVLARRERRIEQA